MSLTAPSVFETSTTVANLSTHPPESSSASEPWEALGSDLLAPLKSFQRELLLRGESVFDLSMVNPDLAPPRVVTDRLLEAVTKPVNHRYAVSRGIRRLREAFAEKYGSRFGISLDPEREVCVCLGSKDATYHTLRCLVSPGAKVVVGAPTYPAHLSAVALVGAGLVPWSYSLDDKEAAGQLDRLLSETKATVVLLNFPNNPTGAVVSRTWWQAVASVAAKHGASVVNDFVYGEMCFSRAPAASLLEATGIGPGCVEVYSLSKAYNVPGWRVGALLGDERIVRQVARLKSHADYGLFLPLQHAAAVALTASEDLARPTVTAYERRIRVLVNGLRKLGWQVSEPLAGASVWARIPEGIAAGLEVGAGRRSLAVAQKLLESHRVLVAPGALFGAESDDFVRFAAVVPEERMRDVVMALSRREQL